MEEAGNRTSLNSSEKVSTLTPSDQRSSFFELSATSPGTSQQSGIYKEEVEEIICNHVGHRTDDDEPEPQWIDTRPIGPAQPKKRGTPTRIFRGSLRRGKHPQEQEIQAELETIARIQRIRALDIHLPGEGRTQGDGMQDEDLLEIANRVDLWDHQPREERPNMKRVIRFVKGAIEAIDPHESDQVEAARSRLLKEFEGKVFKDRVGGDHPIRGPHGEAVIQLKPDAIPVKQRMFHIQGERREAWERLTDEIIRDGKIEPGVSPWSSPSFPVPKKKPGEYRLVEDFRRLNDNTVDDAHPLPRIDDILQKQGNYKIWSVLDLKDGYHQMPMKVEHRPYTCMSTPRGSFQWKVLVMGLKNGNAMFQRMMEWVLRNLEKTDPYVDDIIVGSTGETEQELMENHEKDLRRLLEVLTEAKLVVDPKKANMFMKEVEFCGHILREGSRTPSPGKLLSIQNWEFQTTITALRGFLGLTNYYSSYVPNYANLAAPLM